MPEINRRTGTPYWNCLFCSFVGTREELIEHSASCEKHPLYQSAYLGPHASPVKTGVSSDTAVGTIGATVLKLWTRFGTLLELGRTAGLTISYVIHADGKEEIKVERGRM